MTTEKIIEFVEELMCENSRVYSDLSYESNVAYGCGMVDIMLLRILHFIEVDGEGYESDL